MRRRGSAWEGGQGGRRWRRELKKSTNKLCNSELGYKGQFAWQSGYCAHALGRDRVDSCYDYIKSQQKHHIGMTFAEEWEMMKEAYGKDLVAVANHLEG